MTYTVQPGDSLSIIARDRLGNIDLWRQLADHNRIMNADKIYPGQVIRLDVPGTSPVPADGAPAATQKKSGKLWAVIMLIIILLAVAYYFYATR